MKTKNYFLLIPVLTLVLGSIAFTSCNDDDDKDSKASSLDGYWKLTKSTNSYSSGETTFADGEGIVICFDEANAKETNYEYDYEGQLLSVGSVDFTKEDNSFYYTMDDPKSGLPIPIYYTIKKLTDNSLVLYCHYSEETLYYKRIKKPELKTVSLKKENLLGKWQMIETWKPGDGSAEEIDPTEVRKVWTFEDEDLYQESTSLGWGPTTMEVFKWNCDKNVITLFDYFDPNAMVDKYEILDFDWTYLKIRNWTDQYNYKVIKFKSMAVG